MKKTKKEPAQKRSKIIVDSILEAASRILNGENKESFTTNKIAQVAGVSIGSLYQYFSNKENILEDILLEKVKENINLVLAKHNESKSMGLDEFIKLIVNEQFDSWHKRSELSKKLIMSAPKVLDPSFIMKNDEKLIDFFVSIIQENNIQGVREENLELALKLSINAIRIGIFNYFMDTEKYDSQVVSEELSLMVSKYLSN